MNNFKFNGVGQGLFYAGTLFNGMFNFVFDCGTSNKKSYIDGHINEYIQEITHSKDKPHIHLVVISHLHKDHFSGLLELAKHAVIDKIYLPYLGENKDFIKFALAYSIFYNLDIDEDNYMDSLLLYAYMLRLYQIEDDLYGEVSLNIAMPEQIKFCKSTDINNVKFGIGEVDVIRIDKLWQFEIYYRFFNNDVIDDLKSRIGKLVDNFNSFTLINFIRNSKDAIEKIAKCYEAVFGKANHHKLEGGVNISSAVMIHYPIYFGAYALVHKSNDDKSDFFTGSVVTVLTGDAKDFKLYPNLVESIKSRHVLFFQVPHHGSKDNWDSIKRDGIHKCDIDFFVIPFGLGNSYGHPNVNTLDYLVQNKKMFYNITQLSSLEYKILG